jgi:restriction endonuclease S subunit
LTENKPGGVKGRSQPEFIGTLTIPLPPIEVQEAIVAEIDRQQAIVAGAELILDNWKIGKGMFTGDEIALSDIADIGTGSTPSRENNAYFGGDINWVLTAEVDECEINSTTETLTDKAIKDYGLKIYPENTILVAMYGQGKTRGKSAFLKCKSAITQNCAGIVIRRDDVLPKYIYYYLRSIYEIIRGQEYSGAGVPHLNLKIIGSIRIPIPSKNTQGFIVSMIDGQIATLEGLRAIKTDAEARIKQIVDNVWENR